MYLNKAIILGNLTRDPELKSLPLGTKVTTLGVATNRVWKDKNGVKQEDTQYHNVVIFGAQAEIVAQYLRKGNSVAVEGRLQTRTWDDQDGRKNYRTEIVADRVQFGPKSAPGGTPRPATEGGSRNPGGAPATEATKTIEYPTDEANPDDIPF